MYNSLVEKDQFSISVLKDLMEEEGYTKGKVIEMHELKDKFRKWKKELEHKMLIMQGSQKAYEQILKDNAKKDEETRKIIKIANATIIKNVFG